MSNSFENDAPKPDFESVKQINPYGAEYWSARDLMRLLGYGKWQNFEVAIKRGVIACQQVGQNIADHFTDASKVIRAGKGANQEVKDYLLSRFACYLIAQNGDPRKLEIASAQAYFAASARENELRQLYEAQLKRAELRERVSENNLDLAQAAGRAGVLSKNFGLFQNAGYQGLYGGLSIDQLKERKGIGPKEDILDRMGREELATNDFRITQATAKLRREGIVGQSTATHAHRQVGEAVRNAIEEIGGTMPEELPAEPSIKPLLSQQQRTRKRAIKNSDAAPKAEGEGPEK